MIDETKVSGVRNSIRELATEYDRNALPDVAKTLREIADLAPAQLIRLGDLMRGCTPGVSAITLRDLGG